MPKCMRYACQHELLPVLEGALAANDYHIEIPWQTSGDGTSAIVMCSGTATPRPCQGDAPV